MGGCKNVTDHWGLHALATSQAVFVEDRPSVKASMFSMLSSMSDPQYTCSTQYPKPQFISIVQ